MTASDPLRLAVVAGSTRPGRHAETVARWVLALARARDDVDVELIDVADHALPFLDEPTPPLAGDYSRPHTREWAATIGSFDGYVFTTPEYNHSMPAVLKNAIDFLFAEWNDKAAGFVSYGVDGGVRAAEQLRLVLGELKVADVRRQVSLTFAEDFEGWTTFRPRADREREVAEMLDEVVAWGTALRALRRAQVVDAPAAESGVA